MMIERFASAADGFLVAIAIKRDWLSFVAGTGDVQAGPFTNRDWNPATRHDIMIPSSRQVAMVTYFISLYLKAFIQNLV